MAEKRKLNRCSTFFEKNLLRKILTNKTAKIKQGKEKGAKQANMEKKAFTTSEIARISNHSRDTVKRWLEKGEIKGYRVGTSGHWRVLPKDVALFLKNNNIPFPERAEIGIDLKTLADTENMPTFCWEFHRDKRSDHLRSGRSCGDCLIYKVKSIDCYALRDEVGHRKIYCAHSCEDCTYFHFQHREILPEI